MSMGIWEQRQKNLLDKEKLPALWVQFCVMVGKCGSLRIETSSEDLKFCPWDFKDSSKESKYDDVKYIYMT